MKYFGGGRGTKSRVARVLGVSSAAVSKWSEEIPDGSAYNLCRDFPELYKLDQTDHDSRKKV
jgi:predicted transcriptional regulator